MITYTYWGMSQQETNWCELVNHMITYNEVTANKHTNCY